MANAYCTKHELAITILQALLNVSIFKARHLANTKHGEYVALMKHKKPHLEELHETAIKLLTKIEVK